MRTMDTDHTMRRPRPDDDEDEEEDCLDSETREEVERYIRLHAGDARKILDRVEG